VPEFLREHSVPVVFSVLLHGAIIAALVLTAVISTTHRPEHLQSAPINAGGIAAGRVIAATRRSF